MLFGSVSTNLVGQQSGIHTIVEMKEGCVIGGVRNGQWVAADKFEKSIKGPLKFSLYTLDGGPTEIVANGENAECHELWKSHTGGEIDAGVAIQSPTWNPLPRVPRAINLQDATYVKIVGDILRGLGLKKPEVHITEGYKIDLDGDGKEEVVLVASRYKNGPSELTGVGHLTAPGDYSLVLVRKIVGSKVRNIFLVKDIRLTANEGGLTRGYHLSAIADMNGDGSMELALYSAYYEGSATDILEIKGTKVIAVLGCGCEH